MKTVPVKTYYLEMRKPRPCLMAAPRDDLGVVPIPEPQVSWYRLLYNEVGRRWRWFDRALMSDEQLAPLIRHAKVEWVNQAEP